MVATICGARTAISSQVVSAGSARLGLSGLETQVCLAVLGPCTGRVLAGRGTGDGRGGRGRRATGISAGASG